MAAFRQVVFVGGPRDGHVDTVPETNDGQIPVYTEAKAYLGRERGWGKVVYLRENCGGNCYYRANGMSYAEAVERLLRFYRPPQVTERSTTSAPV